MALARFSSFLPSSRKSSYKSGSSSSKQKNFDPRKVESMTSGLDSEEQARSPGIDYLADHLEDKTATEKGDVDGNTRRNTQEIPPDQVEKIEPSFKLPKRPKRKITKPGEPAYVAPIPKIGSIPPIPPISPGLSVSGLERPKLPPFVGSFLLGKKVDEYGDIVDDKTGQVLARAGGDLPSIVGRQVSNRQGDILGDNGELLGYVADIEIERKGSGSGSASGSPGLPQPRSLFEIMSRSNASLMVDHLGNILDTEGNVVGKFHDNNNPLHRKEKEEREAREESEKKPVPPPKEQQEGEDDIQGVEENNNNKKQKQPESAEQPAPPSPAPSEEPGEEQQKRPRRTEEERRANAQAWRKENPGESPSDIFLDVKSTTEGIQLTIRIPTVFGGQQVRPNISFS